MAEQHTLETLSTKIDALVKEQKAMMKLLRKVRNHQEDPDGEKTKARTANNGFNRPLRVSEALKTFLGLADDETISRSEVTRRINKYITDNGLQHPDNGRRIILDDKLADLLQALADAEITFLNIQKYLSPHYIKDTSAQASASAQAPAQAQAPVESEPEPEAKKKRPTVKKTKA